MKRRNNWTKINVEEWDRKKQNRKKYTNWKYYIEEKKHLFIFSPFFFGIEQWMRNMTIFNWHQTEHLKWLMHFNPFRLTFNLFAFFSIWFFSLHLSDAKNRSINLLQSRRNARSLKNSMRKHWRARRFEKLIENCLKAEAKKKEFVFFFLLFVCVCFVFMQYVFRMYDRDI